jgi:methionine-rich copper-binding protein CopC
MPVERASRPEICMKAAVRTLTLAVVVALAWISTMHADMRFEKAAPAAGATVTAPPPSIQVWFTEAPELGASTLDLRGPSGPTKLTGLHVMDDRSLMAMVADKMPDGAYTVAWLVTARDGRVQKGELVFTLKRSQ